MGAPRRPRPCPWAPLLLLLLLLGGPTRGRASLRLLDHPAPVCAQQGLKCVVKNSTCLDDSWLRLENLTPSPPKNIQVRLHFAHTQHGELLPVLHIEWTLKGDASFQVLKGVELSVLQLDTNERLCVNFKFLNKLEHPAWHFNFSHFVVEPGQKYEVTVNHLPKSSSDGDPNHESRSFPVPGCMDPRMRLTTPCVSSGSLWDPNITVELLEPSQLQVRFTLWNESAQYQVLLHSFPRTENRSCFTRTLNIPAPPEEDFHQQTNVTLSLPDSWCCRHEVQLQPFFGSCLNDCLRYSVALHCPAFLDTAELPADSLPLWAYGLLASITLLLVGSAILLIVCTTWRLAGSHQKKSGDAATSTDVLAPAGLAPSPLKPKKVWIVYSADHPLYVDVVLKFAQFLLTVCGTEVALDLLEEQVISEVGVMAWVGRQKQEMVDSGSKIIVLCSRGTRAQWHAMLGQEEPSVRRRPAGDLFTAAMNMILPDFKQPACFGTYIVCYFSTISSERDIPELFNITSRYPLMDKLEEVYFRVQDLEMFGPGQMRRIGELSGDNYLKSPSGQQLKEAVERFRDWQIQHPDWFERENLCSADNQELQSLDKDVFDKPLLPAGGGIIRQRPLVREPPSQDCLGLDLLLGEGRGVARLEAQVQPQGPLTVPALQTLLLTLEQIPPAQATEPVPHVMAGSSTTSQVTVPEPSEVCPLLDGCDSQWNCVLALPWHAEDLPLCSTPTAPPSLSRAGNLPSSLFQQNLSSQAQPPWVSPAADLKGPLGSCEEEQSDQGYISRSSPQPPEGLIETGKGEGEPLSTLSPEDLESLRSLQQQLFFQELRRDSGWASAEPEMPCEAMPVLAPRGCSDCSPFSGDI